MSAAAAGAAGAVVVAATFTQAIRATGAIVQVEGPEFLNIVGRSEKPLVIHATSGLLKTNYLYLTSYRGLAFHVKSSVPLSLPKDVELIHSKQIWIP